MPTPKLSNPLIRELTEMLGQGTTFTPQADVGSFTRDTPYDSLKVIPEAEQRLAQYDYTGGDNVPDRSANLKTGDIEELIPRYSYDSGLGSKNEPNIVKAKDSDRVGSSSYDSNGRATSSDKVDVNKNQKSEPMHITGTLILKADGHAQLDATGGAPVNE